MATMDLVAAVGRGVKEHFLIDQVERADAVADGSAGPTLDDAELSADELRRDAVVLLSQQCWCWGQDVIRPDGNWLVEIGFERHPPPPELSNCSSVYLLRLPEGCNVVLRGFGVFYGRRGVGGVFLPRFEFSPRFSEEASLRSPPWDETELTRLPAPTSHDRDRCLALLLELIDWIQQYESQVADRLGVAYREQTLANWHNGERRTVPAAEFPAAWRDLGCRIADAPDCILTSACPQDEVTT